jgi:hypothetical protein
MSSYESDSDLCGSSNWWKGNKDYWPILRKNVAILTNEVTTSDGHAKGHQGMDLFRCWEWTKGRWTIDRIELNELLRRAEQESAFWQAAQLDLATSNWFSNFKKTQTD